MSANKQSLAILKSIKKTYSPTEKRKKYINFVSFIIGFVVFFSIIYYILSKTENDFHTDGNKFENYIDAIYFSSISTFTIGYGDFSPTKWYTKLVVIIQVILFWSTVLYFSITVVE